MPSAAVTTPDLRALAAGDPQELQRAVAGMRPARARWSSWGSPAARARRSGVVTAALGIGSQIGRASCRERV